MVECGAEELAEDVMVEALNFGHQSLLPMIEVQERMAAELGKPKREVELFPVEPALVDQIFQRAGQQSGEHSQPDAYQS